MTRNLNPTANLATNSRPSLNQCAYHTALITGASSGIGRALCLDLAATFPSIKIALLARRESELQEVAAEVRRLGGEAFVYVIDVADPQRVERTVIEADDTLGGLDLVIANAGVGGRRESKELQWQHCQPMIDVNVSGAVATLCAVLPRMVARGRGHLVGVSSLAQYRGLPKRAAYSASKAFLSTFLESLRVELYRTGVFVTDTRPGFVRTPMTAKNTTRMPFLMDADQASRILLRGIIAKRAVVAFPWPMVTLLRLLRLLPATVYDPIARAII